MIIVYHNNNRVINVVSSENKTLSFSKEATIANSLLQLAEQFPQSKIVWCHFECKNYLDLEAIKTIFHHNKMMFSYTPDERNYLGSKIGYVEDSPYVNINKKFRYGTWQMSSHVGTIHASVINACKKDLKPENNFDYFLNSLAKRGMPFGLLCYSEPKLLLNRSVEYRKASSNLKQLFKFTKQHYKIRWVFLLLFNLMLFERKFPVLPFLFSFFYKKRNFNPEQLNQIPLNSNKIIIKQGTIDVLIPTIGRKDCVVNVLNNLANQSYLPKNVILIEQNSAQNSISELNFIQDTNWPFIIKHHFTHQSGACNARNIGLKMIESEFTFMADDDIVFENNLLETAMQTFKNTGNEVFLVACHLKSQTIVPKLPIQFPVFGAGHAFVKSSALKGLSFDMAYEFGFGEDADFGMQLRNKGFDVLYISSSTILHLKAPTGGFRSKPFLKWQHEAIQPKPSPTVMLFRLLYNSNEQLRSYKVTLFFKNLNKDFFFNPFKYLKSFKKKWDKSIYWANELNIK